MSPLTDQTPPTSSMLSNARAVLSTLDNWRDTLNVDSEMALIELEGVLEKVMTMSRRIRSTFRPAVNLPPDILAYIFSLVPRRIAGIGQTRPCFDKNIYTQDLCPLTAVCRYWRDIALNTPSLWCTITNFRIYWFDDDDSRDDDGEDDGPPRFKHPHYLHRSALAPLYAYIHDLTQDASNVFEEHASRFHEIYVTGYCTGELLSIAFPNLESCTLRTSLDSYKYQNTWMRGERAIFGTSDRLHTLQFTQAYWLPTNLFPALRVLRLNWFEGQDGSNIQKLLAFLSRCPILQVLQLECHLDEWKRFNLDSNCTGETVRLAHLDTFEFLMSMGHAQDNLKFSRALLGSLSFPETCSATVPLLACSELQFLLGTLWKGEAPTSIKLLPPIEEEHRLPSNDAPLPRLLLEHTSHSYTLQLLLSAMVPESLTSYPMLTAIRSLTLWSGIATNARLWWSPLHNRDFLPSMPQLESLWVSQDPSDTSRPSVEVAFYALEPRQGGDAQWIVPCPLLVELTVYCNIEVQFPYVRQLAKRRAQAGHPISSELRLGQLERNGRLLAVSLAYDAYGEPVDDIWQFTVVDDKESDL